MGHYTEYFGGVVVYISAYICYTVIYEIVNS
jgi:hypothetical protein